MIGSFRFWSAARNQYKVNRSRRYISLELEVAGDNGEGYRDVKQACDVWRDAIVRDGSVPGGYEINTNPSQGDVFISHVNQVCAALNSVEARVDKNCGMHCHIGAEDFRYFDLFKLCRLYNYVEEALFRLTAPSRHNNTYCAKCANKFAFSHYETFKRDLIERLYGSYSLEKHDCYVYNSRRNCDVLRRLPTTRTHARNRNSRSKRRLSPMTDKYNGARYTALNLHSWFYRGTIEFRHFQGTTNRTKATHWGMLCASVVDAAHRMTLKQIDALPLDSRAALAVILRDKPELLAWCDARYDKLDSRD